MASGDHSDRSLFYHIKNVYILKFSINGIINIVLHGAIPTGRFLYGCKYSDSPNCKYCGDLDDLTHIFVTCSRLSGLFQLTQSLIRKLTRKIDKIHVWWYIIGIPASAGLDVNVTHFHLRGIGRIRNLLTFDATAQLIHALITSHLDFCNSILYNLPNKQIERLQCVPPISKTCANSFFNRFFCVCCSNIVECP